MLFRGEIHRSHQTAKGLLALEKKCIETSIVWPPPDHLDVYGSWMAMVSWVKKSHSGSPSWLKWRLLPVEGESRAKGSAEPGLQWVPLKPQRSEEAEWAGFQEETSRHRKGSRNPLHDLFWSILFYDPRGAKRVRSFQLPHGSVAFPALDTHEILSFHFSSLS